MNIAKVIQHLSAAIMVALIWASAACAQGIESSRWYKDNQFVPGADEQSRWELITKQLPTLIGKTDNEVVSLFGGSTIPETRIRGGERWDHPEWRVDAENKDYIYGIAETFDGDKSKHTEIAIETRHGRVINVNIKSYDTIFRRSFGTDEVYPKAQPK